MLNDCAFAGRMVRDADRLREKIRRKDEIVSKYQRAPKMLIRTARKKEVLCGKTKKNG